MFSRHFFYNDLSTEKPAIAISACLMGDAVRYDGQDKVFPLIADFFQRHAQLVKVCPEVGAGMGVPRPAVALSKTSSGIKALGLDNPELDVTTPLTAFSRQFSLQHQQEFQGVIVKSRSPSCGYGSTPIYATGNPASSHAPQIIRLGNGIFAQTLHEDWSQCLIIEEGGLSSAKCCQDFLFRCYVLLDLKKTPVSESQSLQSHYARLDLTDLSLPGITAFTPPLPV